MTSLIESAGHDIINSICTGHALDEKTGSLNRGFGLLTAIFFVMGDVAGSGVLSVPGAIAKTGS